MFQKRKFILDQYLTQIFPFLQLCPPLPNFTEKVPPSAAGASQFRCQRIHHFSTDILLIKLCRFLIQWRKNKPCPAVTVKVTLLRTAYKSQAKTRGEEERSESLVTKIKFISSSIINSLRQKQDLKHKWYKVHWHCDLRMQRYVLTGSQQRGDTKKKKTNVVVTVLCVPTQ